MPATRVDEGFWQSLTVVAVAQFLLLGKGPPAAAQMLAFPHLRGYREGGESFAG